MFTLLTTRVNKFSKFVGIGGKFWGPEGCHEASAGTDCPKILGDSVKKKIVVQESCPLDSVHFCLTRFHDSLLT